MFLCFCCCTTTRGWFRCSVLSVFFFKLLCLRFKSNAQTFIPFSFDFSIAFMIRFTMTTRSRQTIFSTFMQKPKEKRNGKKDAHRKQILMMAIMQKRKKKWIMQKVYTSETWNRTWTSQMNNCKIQYAFSCWWIKEIKNEFLFDQSSKIKAFEYGFFWYNGVFGWFI